MGLRSGEFHSCCPGQAGARLTISRRPERADLVNRQFGSAERRPTNPHQMPGVAVELKERSCPARQDCRNIGFQPVRQTGIMPVGGRARLRRAEICAIVFGRRKISRWEPHRQIAPARNDRNLVGLCHVERSRDISRSGLPEIIVISEISCCAIGEFLLNRSKQMAWVCLRRRLPKDRETPQP